MGYESKLIFSKCCVSFMLLLIAPSWAELKCPTKFTCSDDGLAATSNHQNLIVLPQGPFNRRLQRLDLAFNRIGILKPSMFADRQIYTLVNLTMSNNTISDINEPFQGLSALKYLDLSNNDIEQFNPEIFVDTPNLKTLVLHHNPSLELAETGYDLPELTDLILNNCRIKMIPDAFFHKLKSLEYVNLSQNLIENFDSKLLLRDLANLKHIDLRSNRLHLLGEVVDHLPTSIKDLKISSNPWWCNCEIKEAFALYELGNYKDSPLFCSSPKELKNQSLTAELVKLITCTTTAESTTTASTTASTTATIEPDASVQGDSAQNDQDPDKHVESIGNLDSQDKNGRISMRQNENALSPQETDSTNTDKIDDDVPVDTAGWFGNWMIYSAVALVVATSIVVFFVKYQVTKHMTGKGNALARTSGDFGMNTDGYSAVGSTEHSSRISV